MRITIEGRTLSQLQDYCKLNGIDDLRGFALRCLTQGLSIAMHGLSPMDNVQREINGIVDLPEVPKEPIEVAETKPEPTKKVAEEQPMEPEPVKVTEEPKQKEKPKRKIRIVKKS